MSLAGTLRIDIGFSSDAAPIVRFEQPRPIPVERLFAGLAPAEAASRARLLFAICGNAHAVAMAMACEAAAQAPSPASVSLARTILVACEALREHAARILSDWPKLVGDEPDLAGLRSIVDAFRAVEATRGQAVSQDEPVPSAAAALDLADTVRRVILPDGVPGASAARVIARTRDGQILDGTDAEDDGTVYGRWVGDPRLEGHGLERRVRARLLEVEVLCNWLSDTSTQCPLAMSAHAAGTGRGVAEIDVARGRLVHEVRLEGGLIADYRITAPTTANFAPGGAAERAIRALPLPDRESFEWLARLAILEVDPCVAHDVRIG